MYPSYGKRSPDLSNNPFVNDSRSPATRFPDISTSGSWLPPTRDPSNNPFLNDIRYPDTYSPDIFAPSSPPIEYGLWQQFDPVVSNNVLLNGPRNLDTYVPDTSTSDDTPSTQYDLWLQPQQQPQLSPQSTISPYLPNIYGTSSTFDPQVTEQPVHSSALLGQQQVDVVPARGYGPFTSSYGDLELQQQQQVLFQPPAASDRYSSTERDWSTSRPSQQKSQRRQQRQDSPPGYNRAHEAKLKSRETYAPKQPPVLNPFDMLKDTAAERRTDLQGRTAQSQAQHELMNVDQKVKRLEREFSNIRVGPSGPSTVLSPQLARSACLMCRNRPKKGKFDFCDSSCVKNAAIRSTLLLEVPPSHVIFAMVGDRFRSAWKHPKEKPCPQVLKVWRVVETAGAYAQYSSYLNQHGSESFSYHGTKCKCDLGLGPSTGSNGDLHPCVSSGCNMCCILRTSFRVSNAKHSGAFGPGIYTSTASNKAANYANGLLIVAKVVLGRAYRVERFEEVKKCPANFNSVVFDRMNGKLNETVVYEEAAIRPIYLIRFS